MPPRPVEVRQPTADQRAKIRDLLDLHFDDKLGAYLDGQTDQSIAEAVGVPRVIVETMRETSWGPILVSAETLAAQAEARAVREELAAVAARIGHARADLDKLLAEVAALRDRLDKVAPAAAAKAA